MNNKTFWALMAALAMGMALWWRLYHCFPLFLFVITAVGLFERFNKGSESRVLWFVGFLILAFSFGIHLAIVLDVGCFDPNKHWQSDPAVRLATSTEPK